MSVTKTDLPGMFGGGFKMSDWIYRADTVIDDSDSSDSYRPP